MKIAEIISELESLAHPSLQESYDNAGLITGDAGWECKGVLCTLDCTEAVVQEAADKGLNLVVAHHPIVFGGLKKITPTGYVERTVILAIKKDIAIYAIHTNLDHVLEGVNGMIADKLGLINRRILQPKAGTLKKLYTFAPVSAAEAVRAALFAAGAGQIGQYSECSFNTPGTGTFRGNENSNPFVGEPGKPHQEAEIRIETIFPAWLEGKMIQVLKAAHPYEEVAFDVIALSNPNPETGAGLLGEWPEGLEEGAFLEKLKSVFGLKMVRHTRFTGRPVKKLALCGGAGSFLISRALAAGADAYVTGDLKYHEFFDADGRLLLADIGHYESEQFTISLLQAVLAEKFPTFAVQKSVVNTNPVQYS